MSAPAAPRPEEKPATSAEPAGAVAPSGGLDAPRREDTRTAWIAVLFTAWFTSFGLIILVMIVLGEEVWTFEYWGSTGDRSAVLRNLGLVAVGVIGLPFAIWRAVTAHRQAQAAIEQAQIFNLQAQTSNRQADLAEQGLIIDRYQKGALMLESSESSVRIAGVNALRELALSDPEDMYFLVLDLLFAFVREKSVDRKIEKTSDEFGGEQAKVSSFPSDLQSALTACTAIRQGPKGAVIEERRTWYPELRNANLSGSKLTRVNLSSAELGYTNLSRVELEDANLSGANLTKANLSGANLNDANLFGAFLTEANLFGTRLWDANLSGARLWNANLFGANLRGTNLTGADLEDANLSGARLWNANLSGAYLSNVKTDDKTNISGTWAYKNTPPRKVPEQIKKTLAYRYSGEAWDDFVARMQIERPDLDFLPSLTL